MYYTVKELVGISGMPTNERNVRITLNKLASDDQKRKRENVSSKKPIEYHIDCLPAETRTALLQQQAAEEVEQAESEEVRKVSSEELWYEFDLASESQKERAKHALELCLRVQKYVDNGEKLVAAMKQVAAESHVTYARIHRWFYISPALRTKHIPQGDWLPSLLDGRGGATRTAHIPEEAWEFFKADYLRPEMKSGTVMECYRRLEKLAKDKGWELPCHRVFTARIKRDIPKELVMLKRFGKAEFQKSMLPSQRRSRAGLHAMQVVAGDGHVARVFCKTDDGKIFRPTIWGFIDVYSSMIVGYSVDVSENTEMLGIAIHRMVSKFGTPSLFVLDRGSAALSEAMTGGMSRPKRDGSGKLNHKKFDTYEVEGVIKSLGADVNWIKSVDDDEGRSGNSRANPIERSWHSKGGIGQFEREPAFAKAYTGSSINDKPSNYNSKNAVSIELFLTMLDAWVHEWNNRKGRRTEMAKGQGLSFAQVFERSYEQSAIAKPTSAQLALCLLRTRKAVKVHNGGIVELNAGNYSKHLTNRYQSTLLYEHVGEKVKLRFNPYDLTQFVLAYTEDDRLIGKIPLYEDVDFVDAGAARRQRLLGESELARTEMMGDLMITKSIDELAEVLAPKEHEKTDIGGPVPGITKMVPSMPRTLDDFSDFDMGEKTKRAVGHDASWDADDDYFNDDMTRVIQQQFGK
ncbi:transposase domain-containing protein, partial [Vibrio sp. M260121]|uniref:transposase domain-containing protein n=1 Tax=Vibrio sp. M260121 TaxID=3020897 RepID=UPI002F3F046C